VLAARSGVRLGVPEAEAVVAVPTPEPAPGRAFAPRRLLVRGAPVLELALWCGTCPAVFTRLAGADGPAAPDVGPTHARLDAGLSSIDRRVVRTYSAVLPRSRYTVLLMEVRPRLVSPGDADDYFHREQLATWGPEPVTGEPEDPGTPYYRTFETPVGPDAHLYELVVPMVPPSWNDPERVASYAVDGAPAATAVAYSLLDVVQPATDQGTDYHQHRVLTHVLLDGHHKLEAAARTGRSVRLLAFVDEDTSIATPADVRAVVRARGGPPAARRTPS
jgi:hypothetical protein